MPSTRKMELKLLRGVADILHEDEENIHLRMTNIGKGKLLIEQIERFDADGLAYVIGDQTTDTWQMAVVTTHLPVVIDQLKKRPDLPSWEVIEPLVFTPEEIKGGKR